MNKNLGLILLVIFISGACVLSTPPPRNSRFKVDLTSMQKVDFYHDSWVYRNPKKSITDYKQFIISPARVYENPAQKISKAKRGPYNSEATMLTGNLSALIGASYSLTTKPGPKTARMEMEVVDIKPVVVMLVNGNYTRISDPTTKGSKLELNCYDSKTGELVYGLSTLYKGDDYLAYEDASLLPNIDKAFIEWSTFFKTRFDEAMKK